MVTLTLVLHASVGLMLTLVLHASTGLMPDLRDVLVPMTALTLAGAVYGFAFAAQRNRAGRVVTIGQALAYALGLAFVGLALAGPPEALADDLFSAHMAQHLLLILAAPPLILLGRPAQVVVRGLPAKLGPVAIGTILKHGVGRKVAGVLSHPVGAFVLFNGALALWHIPEAYELALKSEPIHALEHAMFVGGSILFWRLVIDPLPRHHLAKPHSAIGLAFATCMVGNVLAAAITLAPRVVYSGYGPTRPWQIEPLFDQQIGGLVMWLSGIVYFALIFVVLSRESDWSANERSS